MMHPRSNQSTILITTLIFLTAVPFSHAAALKDLPENIQSILKKTAQVYRTAETYQDQGSFAFTFNIGDIEITKRTPLILSYERPDKAAIRGFGATIVTDGKQKLVALSLMNQFKIVEAPTTVEPDEMFELLMLILETDPMYITSLGMLTAEDPIAFLIDDASTISKGDDAEVDDKTCHVLTMSNSEHASKVYIDQESGLVLRRTLEGAGPGSLPGAQQMSEKSSADTVFTGAKVNGKISGNTFALVPPGEEAKVPEFPFEAQFRQMNAPSPIVGKPAPDFDLKTVTGEKLKLSDHKGKVVVLDFWATWCAPCIQAMPDMQSTYEKFKGKDVAVIGMNQDQGGPRDQVKKVVDSRGVTFPQTLDPNGSASQAYGVTAFPTVILVDKQGKIAQVHQGHAPGFKFTLAKEIKKLAAGKSLQ
jgi:peroxiredoxin